MYVREPAFAFDRGDAIGIATAKDLQYTRVDSPIVREFNVHQADSVSLRRSRDCDAPILLVRMFNA